MHPVDIAVTPALVQRNRLTCALRLILAIPHILLVGGPTALSMSFASDSRTDGGEFSSAGVLGVAAVLVAVIAWFAILFTGSYPAGLRDFATWFLRWRVRAVAYTALLRDEYPPFGAGSYEANLWIELPQTRRNRVSVAFRLLLVLPHLLVLAFLAIVWVVTSFGAWTWILLSGEYPVGLYEFAVGVLRWNTRVEAYLLLLHDEYPPFSLT